MCILNEVNLLARVDAVCSETGQGAGCCSANGNQVRVEAHTWPVQVFADELHLENSTPPATISLSFTAKTCV